MLGMYDNAAFSLNYSSSDREDVKCGFLSVGFESFGK